MRGIAVYINSELNATEVCFKTRSKENIWCNIKLKNNDTLLVGCIYRSPTNNNDNTIQLMDLLQEVCDSKPNHLILTGDFNYKEIDWITWYTNTHENHRASLFVEKIRDLFLYQHITEYTRYREGQKPSLLDLILTNEEGTINNIQYLPPLGKSDHISVVFETNLHPFKDNLKSKGYDYNKGNYNIMTQNLKSINWTKELNVLTIENAWEEFDNIIRKETEANIPKCRSRKKKPYINKKAEKKIKKKYFLWKKFKETDLGSDHDNFKRERNSLRYLTRKLQRQFKKIIAKNLKKDPKSFWRYANSKIKTRSKISQLSKTDGNLTENDKEKADVLNTFFSSVFTEENLNHIPTLENKYETPLKLLSITPEMVLKKLKRLKVNKSPGPDGMHPRVLKETAEAICTPLSIIFNKSLEEGKLPQSWKDAHITALHKKGSRQRAENYRPISLTVIFCKIMESILRDQIVDYMITNNLFADQQHGFVPNRSCVTQLLYVIEEWTSWMDESNNIDTIFLDFQKAFDSVPHERLLSKLKSYGILGKCHTWIQQFLLNRRQRVIVGNEKSEW